MESCTFILENGKLMSTQESQSTSVYYSFTFHNQNIEKKQNKTNILHFEWMVKHLLVHPYYEIVLNNKNEWTILDADSTFLYPDWPSVYTTLHLCKIAENYTHTHTLTYTNKYIK